MTISPDERASTSASLSWRRLPLGGQLAFGLLAAVTLIALFAPFLPLPEPNVQDLGNRLASIGSPGHPLGTDWDGRDVLSRLVFASRVSLLAAVEAVAVGFLLGVPMGLLSAYFGGIFDATISRLADALLSFPFLIIAIAIIGVLGPGLTTAMFAIGVLFAPRLFRIVRASALAVKEEDFIEASHAIGCTWHRVLFRHILPNVRSPLIVQASLFLGFAMLAEAGLSFLGLGVQPPQASWGAMIQRGFSYIREEPLVILFPGMAIMVCVLSFNALGDSIDRLLSPADRRGVTGPGAESDV